MNGTSNSRSLRAAFSYCVQQVRSYDYENYLCLLHLPQSLRKAAFALRAFNIETAKARDNVSDFRMALIRLVWWRDIIDNIYKNKVAEHPVAQSLASVIHEHKLNKHWFKRSIEARIADSEMESSPVSLADLEQYAEDTASVLLYLILQTGGMHSTSADHAASHIGKASGLVLLLRATAYHASCHRSYIPLEIAAKHGLSQEQIYKGVRTEALENAIFELASTANTHLEKARELSDTVPKAALPVLLPAVPAQILLDSLQKRHFNVFDPGLTRGIAGVSPLWFQLKLNWYAFRGKY
uniref:15-cis-phytoene synthase n=1 Tax=Araucaria cunninghamii TaxID=56994 RepID=A0A0D6R399_ARACU